MPQIRVSPWRFHRHKHQGCSWHALKAKESPEPLLCNPAGAQQRPAWGRKSVQLQTEWERERLMQPQTHSGVSSIITPLSLWDLSRNEACFLPGAISFYPGWRLKADQWGNNVWCHFHYSDSLPSSLSLSETHRKINSSQKWLKNALGACIFQKSILCYICLCYFGRNCLHRTKQKKWGREKNLKFSCRLETCWLKFNPSRGQGRMWAADLWKSRVEGERWPHRYKAPFILWGIWIWKIPCHLFQETQPPLCRPQDNPLRSMGAWYRWDTWMEPRKTDIALSLETELHLVIFHLQKIQDKTIMEKVLTVQRETEAGAGGNQVSARQERAPPLQGCTTNRQSSRAVSAGLQDRTNLSSMY